MSAPLTSDSIVVAADDQASADMEGQVAIVNLRTGACYTLNPVGGEIWRLIDQPRSVGAVCRAIGEQYGLSPQQAEQDVLALLQELVREGLVLVQ